MCRDRRSAPGAFEEDWLQMPKVKELNYNYRLHHSISRKV